MARSPTSWSCRRRRLDTTSRPCSPSSGSAGGPRWPRPSPRSARQTRASADPSWVDRPMWSPGSSHDPPGRGGGIAASGWRLPEMTKLRLTRTTRGAVVALALALLGAAPAAAAQPTRTVIVAGPVAHYPAGTGCEFDVTVYRSPGSRTTITDFSDGNEML